MHLTIRIHLLSTPAGCDCNGHGTLQGGQCVCSPGYSGATCLYRIEANVDYFGYDLSDSNPSSTICQTAQCCANLCDTYPGGACKVYAWWTQQRTEGPGRCYLKDRVPPGTQIKANVDTGVPEPAPASCPGAAGRIVACQRKDA